MAVFEAVPAEELILFSAAFYRGGVALPKTYTKQKKLVR